MAACVEQWPVKVLHPTGVVESALKFNKRYVATCKGHVSALRDGNFKSKGLRFTEKFNVARFQCNSCQKDFNFSAPKEDCKLGQAVMWRLNITECTCFGNSSGVIDVEYVEDEQELVEIEDICNQGSLTPRTLVVNSLTNAMSSPKPSSNLKSQALTTPKTPMTPYTPKSANKKRMSFSESKAVLSSQRMRTSENLSNSNRWPEAARIFAALHPKTGLQIGIDNFKKCFETSGVNEDVAVDGINLGTMLLTNISSGLNNNPVESPRTVRDSMKNMLAKLAAVKVYQANSLVAKETSEILQELFAGGKVNRNLSAELDSSAVASENDSKSKKKKKKHAGVSDGEFSDETNLSRKQKKQLKRERKELKRQRKQDRRDREESGAKKVKLNNSEEISVSSSESV